MPVQMEWHPSLPVLIATYTGNITQDDYQTMYKRRQAMLQEGPAQVILLANTQHMEAFPDAHKIRRGENIIFHKKVYKTFVVFKPDLHRSLRRAITETEVYDLPIAFFRDEDSALAQAEALSQQLA